MGSDHSFFTRPAATTGAITDNTIIFCTRLVKSVQEQQQIIETQKTGIDQLKALVAELT